MRSTHQFSITFPREMAAIVYAKVTAGGCDSQSEAIREGLRALHAHERAIDEWLRQQVFPAYDAYRADPSRGLTIEEVRASIGKR